MQERFRGIEPQVKEVKSLEEAISLGQVSEGAVFLEDLYRGILDYYRERDVTVRTAKIKATKIWGKLSPIASTVYWVPEGSKRASSRNFISKAVAEGILERDEQEVKNYSVFNYQMTKEQWFVTKTVLRQIMQPKQDNKTGE